MFSVTLKTKAAILLSALLPRQAIPLKCAAAKCLYVNGTEIDEPYTWKEDPKGPNLSDYRKSVVPEGHIFVLGDNRNNSEDSRFADVGFVPLDLVKGKASLAFWPVDRWRMLP